MEIQMFKYGRQPRLFNPRIAHMSAILAGSTLPAPPASVDWTANVTEFGMMLNDRLGDCTCAGIFHARQIWTLNNSQEQTESDRWVLALYEAACDYRVGDPSTDQGGSLQNVLLYCLNTGIPLHTGDDKILGFIEVDPRMANDIKIAINDFGVLYLGFNVPLSIFDENNDPKPVWELTPNSGGMDGGHCVIAAGYDEEGLTIISWGRKFKMTWDFFQHYSDESYAVLSQDWLNDSNKMPLGLSEDQLKDLMKAIKGA